MNQKLLDTARILLDYAGGSLQRTSLNKALFYFDLYWYGETGETYTGARYVAFANGPVVEDYKGELIRPLLQSGDVMETQNEILPRMASHLLMLLRPPPSSPSEHFELLARRVASHAASRTAADLSDYSHENVGWLAAHRQGQGTPINMMLAYQQIAPPDPWLEEPITSDELAHLNAIDLRQRVPLE